METIVRAEQKPEVDEAMRIVQGLSPTEQAAFALFIRAFALGLALKSPVQHGQTTRPQT